MKFTDYAKELEKDIQNAYESSPTIEDAEKLAAKFLTAQIECGRALSSADLDSRMQKSGLKGIKAAVYMDAATKSEKKPTEAMLAAIVDTDRIVQESQDGFDRADVHKNELANYLDVFKNAHIYFRSLAKGRFE